MNTVITKKEIIEQVSEETGIPAVTARKVVESLIGQISNSLANGDTVVFRNFGTFEINTHQPKIGRNPKNPSVDIRIPERKVVKFKVGKQLKESVA